MKIAKALLFILMFMSALFWFMSWNRTQRDYPPVEQMLSIQGKVISIGGKQGKTDGWLTLDSESKTLNFTVWISKQTFKKYGDLIGKEVLVKVHPDSNFASVYVPLVRHFELFNGPVVFDYQTARDKHVEYMKKADDILFFLRALFFIFLALFTLCFFKRGSSAPSNVKKQPKTKK
ncbi:MAG: hypothetical protein AB1780_05700 [Pseudomonadota bacterium]|uniref:hypothetical protein n=1 Tax=Rheinheimera fenheensis TaxID=3152295 RepID=UPI0032602DDB